MKNPKKVKAHLSYEGMEIQTLVKQTTEEKIQLSDHKLLGKVVSFLKLSLVLSLPAHPPPLTVFKVFHKV